MKKSIRIGGASGFWGDSVIATPQLLNGNSLDFIVYDYLAAFTTSTIKIDMISQQLPSDILEIIRIQNITSRLKVAMKDFNSSFTLDLNNDLKSLINNNNIISTNDEIQKLIAVAIATINIVDCSLPNGIDCSILNRYNCKHTSHTCGSCLSGYDGQRGDSNTACIISDINSYHTRPLP